MRISNLGQVNPVVTGAILDATLPATNLAKRSDTVRLGDDQGPGIGSFALLVLGLFAVYAVTSSSPTPPGGTIRGL